MPGLWVFLRGSKSPEELMIYGGGGGREVGGDVGGSSPVLPPFL